jgi:hypothetical protein
VLGEQRSAPVQPGVSLREPDSGARYRALDIASCAAFVLVSAVIARDVVAGAMARPSMLWLGPLVGLAGYVAADLASGVVHWLADTYGSPSTPLLGAKLVTPFREHHQDPQGICRHGWLEANGDNCLITQLVLLPTWALVPAQRGGAPAALAGFVLVLAASVVMTSVIHGWAHAERPPLVARALQRAGLVLTPEHHARHHVSPHATHYCITTGWLNPLLDRTRAFRRLERALAALGIHRDRGAEQLDRRP